MTQTVKKQLGDRGETLVAEWLRTQGWAIVAQQWHCRWGELDIVAQHPQQGIAFVEVKTRQQGSLDLGGKLAITSQKQQKLWQSAQQFLTEYPHWAEQPCRFDVALVIAVQGQPPHAIAIDPAHPKHSALALVEYIENAFQLD